MHGIKKFVFQTIALLLIITAAMYFYISSGSNFQFQKSDNKKKLQINNSILKVEIADTEELKKAGLGGRQSLASDEGMLFVYSEKKKYSFWMKGLSFPLDFIWIKDGVVVDIIKNVLPPLKGQKDESLPVYQAIEPVNQVLEVNAGVVDRFNIKIGDNITLLEN